jgi:hypothetical protein
MPNIVLMAPHVLVGALALTLFWRTILAVKGSRSHRRWGRVYLLMLIPLLGSVIPISLHFGARDPAKMVQLVYLALVLGTAGWTAWRAIRDREAPARFRGPVFRLLAIAMATCGSGLMVIGILKGDVLAVGFAVIGIVYGGAMLGELGRPPASNWWLNWHLNGVALLFAATHASFIGLVARNLFPALAGERMHALTQLGTIAFAYGLRQWLGRRYAHVAPGDRAQPVAYGENGRRLVSAS